MHRDSHRNCAANWTAVLLITAMCQGLAFAQASTARVSIQLEKLGWYWDGGDPGTFGTVSQSAAPLPAGTLKPMMRNAIIADVVSVNGKPARGTYVSHGLGLSMTNTDLGRNHLHQFVLNIQTPDRRQVGDLLGTFLSAGGATPGAPAGAGHWAVTGGTGAYVGIRGQGSNTGGSDYHITLMQEDTSARRTNSNGRLKLDFYLSNSSVAQVQGAFHSADGTAVSTAKPAQPGDILMLQVKASWPASPPLEPGATFTADPLQVITVPIEATVNGQHAEIVNAVGWPGTSDSYRVDVRLPAVDGPLATVQLITGYILPGAPYRLPIR